MSGPVAARHLTVCADDYGMNDAVSQAIRDLAVAGRVSATSCMANAPDWREAAKDLAHLPLARAENGIQGWAPASAGVSGEGAANVPVEHSGRIGIGLHLTLSWGAPLGPMPRLAPGGAFPPLRTLLRASLSGRLELGEIRAEIERQIDAFCAALGRPPDFVDGHQHVHVLPGIRRPLIAALARRGWAGRLWLRDPSDTVAAILARRLAAGKALFVATLAAGFRREARRAGFDTNEGFSGFGPFDPARNPAADMARYLTRPGPRPLVMCHPGHAEPVDPTDAIAAARVREYEYLASEEFPALLARMGLQITV